MDVSAPEMTEELFRFALLRTGSRKVALELAHRATAEAEVVSGQWRTRGHLFLWAARFVADKLEGLPPSLPSGGDLPSGLDSLLKTSSTRLRSAVALHWVGEVKLNELSQVLRLRPREIRAALAEAKQRMVQTGLSESQVRERIREITLSAEERTFLENSPVRTSKRPFGAERALGVSAVFLGVFMFLGWVVWERWRESEPVQVRAQLQRLLEAGRGLGPAGVEKFEGSAADTPDRLFLHGMEGVEVPESFARLKLSSVRLLEFNGAKMAQFATEESSGVLLVGPADALGFGGERSGTGRTAAGEWNGAWAVSGPYAFILAVKDSEAQLSRLLEGGLRPGLNP